MGLFTHKCRFCNREISEFNMFNEWLPLFECCSQCLEKEIEKGNPELLAGLFRIDISEEEW